MFWSNAFLALLSGYIGAWKIKSFSLASVSYNKIILLHSLQSFLLFLPHTRMNTKKANYGNAGRIHYYLRKSDSTEQEKYKILLNNQKFNLGAALHGFSDALLLSKCGESSAKVK